MKLCDEKRRPNQRFVAKKLNLEQSYCFLSYAALVKLRAAFSFILRIIRGLDYPRKLICNISRIIRSVLNILFREKSITLISRMEKKLYIKFII